MGNVTSSTVQVAAARTWAAPPALTFDERLALSPLAMDARLNLAGLAFEVNTASIPIELPEILAAPQPLTRPVPGTAVEVLREAGWLIREHGWIGRWLTDGVAMCAKGAIQKAAGGEGRLADEAEDLLLARIHAEAPDTLSIGAWNDAQSGPAPVIRMLGM